MDLVLASREKKLKQEQDTRKRKALRKKREEERRLKKAREEKRKMERHRQLMKEQQAAREEEARERQLEEERITGGVHFSVDLRPVLLASDGDEDDRITLPSSHLQSLMTLSALDMGPLTFRLTRGTFTTHAGSLDFTAAEDTVGLPRKVWRCLGLGSGSNEGEGAERVTVKFVRLERGTFVRFVASPVEEEGVVSSSSSSSSSGLEFERHLKGVLETNLQKHATLTEGDDVVVFSRGRKFMVRVRELKPAAFVSILNTDLEVVFGEEEEEAEREMQEEEEEEGKEEEGKEEEGKEEEQWLAPGKGVRLGRIQSLENRHLLPEQEEEETDTAPLPSSVNFRVRLPSREVVLVSLSPQDPVSALFEALPLEESVKLLSRFPRFELKLEEGRLVDVMPPSAFSEEGEPLLLTVVKL